MMPSGGNMAGRNRLPRTPALANREACDQSLDHPGDEVRQAEDQKGHPSYGKVIWTQSLTLAPDKRDRLISQQNPSGRPAQVGLMVSSDRGPFCKALLSLDVRVPGSGSSSQSARGRCTMGLREGRTSQGGRRTPLDRRCTPSSG